MTFYLDLMGYLSSVSLLARVFVLGLVPFLLTCLGVVPVVFLGRSVEEKWLDLGLGFSAGVMLVASFTSLLLPAVGVAGVWVVVVGFVVGVVVVRLLDVVVPHMHVFKGYEGPRPPRAVRRAWLLVFAMMIHNIPEGMAVGAAAIYSVHAGLSLAIAIGVQDIPEGLAVAMPLYASTHDKKKSVALGVLSGFLELLAAMIPLLVVTLVNYALPILMSLAAGAMVYVVVHEITPEIYGHSHDDQSTAGFIIGFITTLILETILG
ncbi:ZIP family metal transporter [Desulfurococcaceae archaeon MEX13E-LK6-19]|nr:ZIP family metal transporter [Desulfurococcaceae archaeon MEX13E-LK6-19]